MLIKAMLKKAFEWGWIDEFYLDALIATGQITTEDKAEIMLLQQSKIVSITRGDKA